MKKDKNSKKTLKIFIILVVIFIILFILDEVFFTHNTEKNNNIIENNVITQDKEQGNIEQENKLSVFFIETGQADSILLTNKDQSMLIDAGSDSREQEVVDFIKNKGITKLNYVFGTNTKEEHIGGLDEVVKNFETENIYLPNIQVDEENFKDAVIAIQDKGLKIKSPEEGYTFKIGDAICEVMSAKIDPEDINYSSIIIKVTYGNKSFLFMSDAETKTETEGKWSKVDVLKVGNHGLDTSSSVEFLDQVKPEVAVIMSEIEPEQETLDRLQKIGSTVYKTNQNGTITITTDGDKLEVNKEK